MEFCPGIYEYAAAILGRSPWDVSRSCELLVQAHREAWKRHHYRIVVVGIDVYNIEPEAFGAMVSCPPGNQVPAITAHPCEDLEELAGLPPFNPGAGRIPLVLQAAQELADVCAGAEVRVPVCGPMALAGGLIGLESLLMGLIEAPAGSRAALEGLVDRQCDYLDAIARTGVRPIVFESGTTPPLLPVSLFDSMEVPLLERMFACIEELFAERACCIIGGDAAPIASHLFALRPGYVIAPAETDQASFIEAAGQHCGIHIRVNLPSSCLVANDDRKRHVALQQEVSLARLHPNSSLGCGVVPYETDNAVLLKLGREIQSMQ